MKLLTIIAAFGGGYVAAVFTWDRVHAWIIGAEAKAAQLRVRASALLVKVRSL